MFFFITADEGNNERTVSVVLDGEEAELLFSKNEDTPVAQNTEGAAVRPSLLDQIKDEVSPSNSNKKVSKIIKYTEL